MNDAVIFFFFSLALAIEFKFFFEYRCYVPLTPSSSKKTVMKENGLFIGERVGMNPKGLVL